MWASLYLGRTKFVQQNVSTDSQEIKFCDGGTKININITCDFKFTGMSSLEQIVKRAILQPKEAVVRFFPKRFYLHTGVHDVTY